MYEVLLMSERALRQKLCELSRTLYDRGHNAPIDGNLSARLSERYLLTTPSGGPKAALVPNQIVKVAAVDGRPVDDMQRPSSELKMHLALYRARPDVHAIIHAHSPYTVALTVAGVSMMEPVVPEVVLALGGVPTVPYASPTTSDVPDAVLSYAAKHDAFVLERHGTVVLAKDLDTAFMYIEVVEHTAKITALALAVGASPPLPAAELIKLEAIGQAARAAVSGSSPGAAGRSSSAGPSSLSAASYRRAPR